MLAVVFRCTKFHGYIYRVSNIIVESDNKPLEAIFKKVTMPSTLVAPENHTGNTKVLTKCSLHTWQGTFPCRHVWYPEHFYKMMMNH